MTDRQAPSVLGSESETLVAFLDYLREAVALKSLGIDAEAARRPMVPSGTSLVGLVSHLTGAERWWFRVVFAGDVEDLPHDAVTESDSVEDVVAAYREACRRSNEIVRGCDDLETVSVTDPGRDRERPTLRWVLVHMVEETGRHAGHADILRELIDGSIGR